MASPKLTTEQRQELLRMLAAREPYRIIRDKFDIVDETIDYYRSKYADQLQAARAEYDARNIDRGLRSKEKRLEELEELYRRHKQELDEKGLHYTEIKLASTGLTVEYEVYNAGLVAQVRGLLDDLAKETGGRVNKTELSGKIHSAFIVDIDGSSGDAPKTNNSQTP